MTRNLIILLLASFSLQAQVTETFDDGDFATNPQWIGTSSKFIIDSQHRLQLDAPAEASTAWLFTASAAIEEASWQIDFVMDFNPSSSNYARVWIAADANDPAVISNGLSVSLGASDDAVSLQLLSNGKTTTLIKGSANRINLNRPEATVKVVRNGNTWRLETYLNGEWYVEGEATYRPAFDSQWFGVFCNYTQTRSNKFWFDNIFVDGEPRRDHEPPIVTGQIMKQPGYLEVIFDEDIYISDSRISFLGYDDSKINKNIILGKILSLNFPDVGNDIIDEPLNIKNISDLYGNTLQDTTLKVSYNIFRINNITTNSSQNITIEYNNLLAEKALQSSMQILIDNTLILATNIGVQSSKIDIALPYELVPNRAYNLTISGVKDIYNNISAEETRVIGRFAIERNSLVITEFMADPDPSAGLPVSEYVELYNNSQFDINLKDWKLTVNKTTGVLPAYTLSAGDYVAVVPSSSASLFGTQKKVNPSRWPEITNAGASIVVASPEGVVTDALSFTLADWGDKSFKDDGGWAFEIIDIANRSALPQNWSYSMDHNGGTPSEVNSINANNPDRMPPVISHIKTLTDNSIEINFNEPVSIVKFTEEMMVTINGVKESISWIEQEEIFLKRVTVSMPSLPERGKIYTINVIAITDIAGNKAQMDIMARFGIQEEPKERDVVINELMFNTVGDAPDFIELTNISSKIISLKDIYLGKLDGDIIKSLTPISASDRFIFPGDYVVSAPDSLKTVAMYECKQPEWVVKTAKFPSLSDDGECLILALANGTPLESFCFDKKMHSPLLKKHDGVSLERIDPSQPASNPANWMTAAASHGYSTPTAQNSQYRAVTIDDDQRITIEPAYFTPDADGEDDYVMIYYTTDSGNWNGTATIYNARGVPVKTIANNETLGTNGVWRWDGLDDNNQLVAKGNYIILLKMFSTDGRTKTIKKTVTVGVVARK